MAQPVFDDLSQYPGALSFHNPSHVVHHRVFIYNRHAPGEWPTDSNSRYPYSYHLVREWDCNCVAPVLKRKTVIIIRLESPLTHPDRRIYECLCRLEPANPTEPPHAQAYRESHGQDGMTLLDRWTGTQSGDVHGMSGA